MIREYFGNLGTGKTFNMSYDTMWWLKKGLRVVSNYEIAFCTKGRELNKTDHALDSNCQYKGNHCWSQFYPDPEEYLYHIIKDQHTLFIVDEASIVFPPRVKLPRTFLHKFLQSRKDSCHLFYTAQVPKYVYPMLRYLTNETVRCSTQKAWGGLSKVPYFHFKGGKLVVDMVDSIYFKARWYNTSVIEKKMNFYDRKGRDRAWRTRVISPANARPIFRAYNTLFKVDYSENFKTKSTAQKTAELKHKPIIQAIPETPEEIEQVVSQYKPNLQLLAEAERVLRDSREDLRQSEKPLLN